MSFDADYGPYTGHPSDPRYDDSEDLARDKWECDETYIDKLGADAVEEIMWALQFGKAEEAKADLIKAVDAAWQQYKTENTSEPNE
jgi:hypothetical protein